MLLTKEVRESKERERQINLIRQYNITRKMIFEKRVNKFLNIYPYAGDYGQCISKFSRVVETADIIKLNVLIEAFNNENNYWSTNYALQSCNASIYQHIMTVLALMHERLASKVQIVEAVEVDENEEQKTDNIIDENIPNDWGKIGEKEVDYVLKWLPQYYSVIDKDCVSKYDNSCILLQNKSFIDDQQEYDHILVGPQGVFLIETKNYSGKLHIDSQGNWSRMKKNEDVWGIETNPLQQVTRHHVLLESIVSTEVPIIDIICLSHPDIITSGIENSKIPVIRKDVLGDFIINYPGRILEAEDIKGIISKINDSKVSKKTLSNLTE